jgi:hypothetical protein
MTLDVTYSCQQQPTGRLRRPGPAGGLGKTGANSEFSWGNLLEKFKLGNGEPR